MENYRFHLIGLRLIVSLVASFDININGHWYLLAAAVKSPRFHLAFTVSTLLCYLLLYLVHQVYTYLNQKFPWGRNWLLRLLLQLICGILLPAVIDLLLIVPYYFLSGRSALIKDHIYYEYPRVVLFIGAINLVYCIVQFALHIYQRSTDQPNKNVEKMLTIKHNGAELTLNIEKEILAIHKEGRNIKVITISGHTYTKKDRISAVISEFNETSLCQVNPSAIVNIKMLKGKVAGTRSKTLRVLFKPEFVSVVTEDQIEKLTVTRKYINDFKIEMKKILAG